MIESIISVPQIIEESLQSHAKNFERLGFPYVGYALIGPTKTTGFFSNPDWKRTYIDDRNSILDPYTKLALKKILKVFVWDDVSCNKEEMEICHMRKKICDIENGLTFTHQQGAFYEIFALATDSKSFNLHEMLLNNRELNKILYFQQQMFFDHMKAHEK